jgi:hypothetical protein
VIRELLARESRFPPLLGTGLAAVLMGAVAVVSAQASRPLSPQTRAAPVAPYVAPVAAPDNPPRYAFASPLAGFAVNSPFGLRKMPWEEGGRLHEGVDIAAPAGTPVRATLAGTVLRAGVDGGYGRFVEVSHGDGLTSLYAHLGRAAKGLRRGKALPAGFVVGYVGSTGHSTGAHLHFEIRQSGRPLNPTAFMGRTFATIADLPLTAAGRVPRRVRVAQVAAWPRGVAAPRRRADRIVVAPPKGDGRVRATILPVRDEDNAAPAKAPRPAPAEGPIPTAPVSAIG